MLENEPKIEYEPSPEKREKKIEIPESKSEKKRLTEREEERNEEIIKKKEEIEEKEEAYKEEVEELVSMAKEEGFSKALKKAKKLSRKKSAIIIDRFHDRLSQEDLND